MSADACELGHPRDLKRAEYTLKFTRRILDTIYGAEREFGEYGSAHTGQTDAAE